MYFTEDHGSSGFSFRKASFIGSYRTWKDVGCRDGEARSEEGEPEEGRHERAALAETDDFMVYGHS
jgi:hypothetical protein